MTAFARDAMVSASPSTVARGYDADRDRFENAPKRRVTGHHGVTAGAILWKKCFPSAQRRTRTDNRGNAVAADYSPTIVFPSVRDRGSIGTYSATACLASARRLRM